MPSLSPISAEVVVNTSTAGVQTVASLSVLANGAQVAAWLDEATGSAKLRMLAANGQPISGEIAVGPATHLETAALPGGGFVATWIERLDGVSKVHARTFDAAGAPAGSDTVLSTYTDSLARSYEALGVHAEALTDGGFAVTWTTESHDSFFIHSVARNLTVVDSGGVVVSQTGEALNTPSKTLPAYDAGVRAVELADGRLLVTWWVKPTATEIGGQRVQVYDLHGSPTTAAMSLDRGFPLDGGYRAEGPDLDMAVLPDGRLAVAWQAGGNVVCSVYSSSGVGEHVIDDRTPPQVVGAAGAGAPHIAVLADGRFSIAWSGVDGGEADATLRVFTAGGIAEGPAIHLGSTVGAQDLAWIGALANGGVAAAWRGADADGLGVRVQLLAPSTPAGPIAHIGGAAGELMAGGAGDDWLYGRDGADTLSGGFGSDLFILGGSGTDRVLDYARGVDHLQIFDASGQIADGSRGLLIFNPTTGLLSWDRDSDAGAARPEALAFLDGVTGIDRSDIAAGFHPSAIRILQAGGREELVFDWGAAAWDQTRAVFNAAGVAIVYEVRNDDGTASTTWFDDASTQPWSSRYASYSSHGSLTGYQVALDDGRHTVWTFDPDNVQTWSRAVDEYDAGGRLVSRGWAYDDGWSKMAVFDVDNQQPWAMRVEVYSPLGQRTALWTYMDDGSFVG